MKYPMIERVCCAALLLLCAISTSPAEPSLEYLGPGMWWITESHVLLNVSQLESGPRKLQDTVFKHKWSVAGKKKQGGQDSWVVEVYAHEVPGDVKNDHQDNWLFRLWLDESTLALRRLDTNFRHGKYLVTGDIASQRTIAFSKRNPVATTWVPEICPLDVPVLAAEWRTKGLANVTNRLSVKDERSGDPVQQDTEGLTDKSSGEYVMQVRIETKHSGIRIQKWVKSCPWWIEWRREPQLPNHPGLVSAKTIDWKGKK